jgi:divalent metal cation (Fe/Co/Zn/Cd) transporter
MAHQAGQRSIVKAIRDSKDPSVVTVLFEDTAALIGLIAAFAGIYLAETTGDARFDGVGSLVIGVVLAVVAVVLAAQSRGLLVGERADSALVAQIRRLAEEDPGIARVGRVRTMHLGPGNVLVTLNAVFAGPGLADVEQTVERVRKRLRAVDNRLLDVTIEPVRAGGEGAETD